MRGNPLPESCAMLFTTLCTGWILKKRARKIVFAQKYPKSENREKITIYSPRTPDQPPFKGGCYVKLPQSPAPEDHLSNPRAALKGRSIGS